MALFDLTSEGFQRATFDEIVSSMSSSAKAKFGDNFDTTDASVAGNLIRLVADVADQLGAVGQAVYNSFDPDTASGVNLDRGANITGITRLEATQSLVTAVVTGDHDTNIPSGSVVEVDGTGDRFASQNLTNLGLSAATFVSVEVTTVLNTTLYSVTINGTVYDYTSDGDATDLEIAAGLVAAITGGTPPVTAVDNLDGTFTLTSTVVTTTFETSLSAGLTPRKVSVLSSYEAEVTGPIQAPASTLTEIITPVIGWDSITNPFDATLGRDRETDTELRIRRRESLAIAGATTLPAIKSALLELDSVEAAIVIENDTNSVDGDGRPPKSFECIVLGGVNQDIAGTIWDDKPIGIETVGDITEVYIDNDGVPRNIKFSRPTEIYVHVRVSYTLYSEETFPTLTGEQTIADTVLATGQALSINDDVIPDRFKGPIYNAVDGVGELTIEVATSATPGGAPGAYQTTTLAIAETEISSFDSSRIIVQQV